MAYVVMYAIVGGGFVIYNLIATLFKCLAEGISLDDAKDVRVTPLLLLALILWILWLPIALLNIFIKITKFFSKKKEGN